MPPFSSKPSNGPETPRILSFRGVIALILAGITGGALDHWVIHPSSGVPKPPAPTLGRENNVESRAETAVHRARKAHRLFFLSGVRQELSDEEITRRYLERERERLAARAEKVVDELKVSNPADRAKIAEAVKAGCTEIHHSDGREVDLKRASRQHICGPIELDKDTGSIWVDPQSYDGLSEAEKMALNRYRSKDFEGFLREASFEDTRDRLHDFCSQAFPGQEGEARTAFEGLLGQLEQAREAYFSGDIPRIKELGAQIEDFDSDTLSPQSQVIFEEMEEGIPSVLLGALLEALGNQIEDKSNP